MDCGRVTGSRRRVACAFLCVETAFAGMSSCRACACVWCRVCGFASVGRQCAVGGKDESTVWPQ
eukprot:1399057-Prymnesium_polylepis.1